MHYEGALSVDSTTMESLKPNIIIRPKGITPSPASLTTISPTKIYAQSRLKATSRTQALQVDGTSSTHTSLSIYEPLTLEDSFRILTLEPSDDEFAPVVCSITECSMQEGKRYVALSYEWNDPTFTDDDPNVDTFFTNAKEWDDDYVGFDGTVSSSSQLCPSLDRTSSLVVNGQEMQVTPNLLDALVYFRSTLPFREAGVFWVDALCINQSDVVERSAQVKMMGDIYRNAHRVICWLGRATRNSYSQDDGAVCLDVLRRSYWRRAWIIQEFVLAKNISMRCGHRSFMLHHNQEWRRLAVLNAEYDWGMGAFGLYNLRNDFAVRRQNGLPLSQAIRLSIRALANDPRDLVYAVLGLVNRNDRKGLEPDYTLSPCEIFCQALVVLSNLPEMQHRHQRRNVTASAYFALSEHITTFGQNFDPFWYVRKECDGQTRCLTRRNLGHSQQTVFKLAIHNLRNGSRGLHQCDDRASTRRDWCQNGQTRIKLTSTQGCAT